MRFNKYSWYRISVYSKVSIEELTIKTMLSTLKDLCKDQYISWNPLYMQEGGEKADELDDDDPKCTFYVRTFGQAKSLQDMFTPKKSKMWLRYTATTPQPKFDNIFKNELCQIIFNRYRPVQQSLDLSSFWEDPLWGDMFCALSEKSCMAAAIKVMIDCMPKLRDLCLNSNDLEDLSAFEGTWRWLPELRVISLLRNQLQNIESLKVFAELPLEELNIEFNPLSTRDISKELLMLFPNLKIIDGRKVEQSRQTSPLSSRSQVKIYSEGRSRRDYIKSMPNNTNVFLRSSSRTSRSLSVGAKSHYDNELKGKRPHKPHSLSSISLPAKTNFTKIVKKPSKCIIKSIKKEIIEQPEKVNSPASATSTPFKYSNVSNAKTSSLTNIPKYSKNWNMLNAKSRTTDDNDVDDSAIAQSFPKSKGDSFPIKDCSPIVKVASITEIATTAEICEVENSSFNTKISSSSGRCPEEKGKQATKSSSKTRSSNRTYRLKAKSLDLSQDLVNTESLSNDYITLPEESCTYFDSASDAKSLVNLKASCSYLSEDISQTAVTTPKIKSNSSQRIAKVSNSLNDDKSAFQSNLVNEVSPIAKTEHPENLNSSLKQDVSSQTINKSPCENAIENPPKSEILNNSSDFVYEINTNNTADSREKAAQDDLNLFLNKYLKSFDKNRAELEWFYHKKAMVVFIECPNIFLPPRKPQEMSLKNALFKFESWPKTEHWLSTITVKLTVLQSDLICFKISGIVKTNPENKCDHLYFIRTFVLTPVPDVEFDFRIWNEYFYTTAARQWQLNMAADAKTKPNSSLQEKEFNNLVEIFLCQIDDRISELSRITNMKRDWCYKCLVDKHWDLEAAKQIFVQMNDKGLIPDVAFI